MLNNRFSFPFSFSFSLRKNSFLYQKDACNVMVVIRGNGCVNLSLDEAICISYSVNTLGKGMHPTILPSAMGK